MPVFIIAFISLAVFGVIGILLFTATVLEHRMRRKEHARSPNLDGVALAGKP